MKNSVVFLFTLFALIAFLTLAPDNANALPVVPDFNAATFEQGAPVNNPFFPLIDGRTRIFVGQKEEDGEIVEERFELTDLVGVGREILGVQTTTQLDRAFEDGLLVEETFDYYAQDTDGNVWYLGEDVTNYIYDDDGNLIETTNESAWIAGENGALPGYIMPADPTDWFFHDNKAYYQEYAPDDEALDQASTFSVGNFISIGIGDFTDVLQVLETTELDPDAREFKYYAPGHGLILVEEGLNEFFEDPELTLELVRVIPEPATLTLLGLGLVGIGYLRRKKRDR